MIDFYLGITIGFILIAAFTAWSIIAVKGRILFKFIGTFILIYYGIAVFFSVKNILGWPIESNLPANAKIISVRIIEPSQDHEGGMWFWLNEKPDYQKDFFNGLRPDKIFIYTGSIQPRAYKIPYDKKLHKKLFETQKQGSGGGKFLQTGKKGVKRAGEGSVDDKEPPFRIINPIDIFPKD